MRLSTVVLYVSPLCTSRSHEQAGGDTGLEWGEKKKICNKFGQPCPVTCVVWPSTRPSDVVFGCSDGKVKMGQLRNNRTAPLFNTDSYVVSLCCSPDGKSVLSGHLDGSIYRFTFEDGQYEAVHVALSWLLVTALPSPSLVYWGIHQEKLIHHPSIPYALAWGEDILVGGPDCRVIFYDTDGQDRQKYDFSRDAHEKEFTCATFNPSGKTAVVGSFDRIHIFNRNTRRKVCSASSHVWTVSRCDSPPVVPPNKNTRCGRTAVSDRSPTTTR